MKFMSPRIFGRLFGRSSFISRSLPHSATYWIIPSYSLLWLVVYFYCRHSYSHDPTSFFFDLSRSNERIYSLERQRQADSFIEAANRSSSVVMPKANPCICLGVATVARSEDQYISRTIGSLLDGLTEKQESSIHLAIFFAQTNPREHPVYNKPWLRNVANEIIEYNVSTEASAQLRSLEENHQVWNKSILDYEYLLNKCLDTKADWMMIVEDDVLAKEGWYSRAMEALGDIDTQMKDREWLYLRLFYTEKLFGWNREEWPQYLIWSSLALLVTITTLLLTRHYSPGLRRSMPNTSIAVVCFFCLPATILLYFMAGRVSMQPLRPGLQRMDKFGCCSQGLIFPRLIVPRAIEAIRHATDQRYYVDMTLERWADAEGLPRFALVPSLLQHVGSKSSKGPAFDEGSNSIWNFEFENYT